MYFHATSTDCGDTFTGTNGGYYERIPEDGECPTLIHAAGNPIGFETSETPAIAGSLSPEACLFALLFNTDTPGTYHIYTTDKDPDADLSRCGHDFSIIEEIRWFNPNDTPVPFTKFASVEIPARAVTDVHTAYDGNPHDPNRDWAEYVKYALRAVIVADVTYPENLADSYTSPYADYF